MNMNQQWKIGILLFENVEVLILLVHLKCFQ
jgi:hypothetical protein